MSSDDISSPVSQKREGALQLGPRKKPYGHSPLLYSAELNRSLNTSCRTDPLVHHVRHFGWTVHALCNIAALLNNGLLYMGELSDQPDEISPMSKLRLS